MAEQSSAPYPVFTNIDFNPAFFPSATSEYVEFPTAQGTVTFGDIFATDIDTPSPSVDFDFLSSEIGNINIGASVPSLKTIKLGADTGTTVQCGSIACSGTAIDNAVAFLAGDLSLGAGQTTGILNLGTGFRTTGGSGGGINIGSLATGAIPIVIGTTGQTTTTLRGTAVNVVTKLTSPTVDATLDTTNMTIGSNLRGGNLTIGGSSGHTGAINIGSGQTTGALNIGNGARTGTATINIGTQAATSANMGINIGTPTNTFTTLHGSNVGVETQMSAPIINAKLSSTAMTIGANLTDGTLTIGGTAQTGDVFLASGQTSGDLYIGTGQRTNASDINIGTGSNSTTAGGNLYIGHKTGSGASAQTVKINTCATGTGATTIGSNASSTTIDGTLTVTGAITANGGLTIPSGDILTVTGSLQSNTVDAATAGGAMTVGGNLTTGTLVIGGTQTALISLGAAQTAGNLNIGTGARTATSAINIGTGSSTANVITIGSTSSSIVLNSTSVKATTKLTTPILDCVTDAGAGATSLSIGPSATAGNIVIGAALGTGDVSIATAQAATGTVTIGSSNTATSIGGTLSCINAGILGGAISYIDFTSASLSLTGSYAYMLFINCGTTAAQTLTLPVNPIANQYISIRIVKGAGGTVTVSSAKNIYLNNVITSTTSVGLNNSQSLRLYYTGIQWMEY